MSLWPLALLLLAGCETRSLQSCLASVVLLGPAELTLQCPPRDFYTRPLRTQEDTP